MPIALSFLPFLVYLKLPTTAKSMALALARVLPFFL